MSAETSKYLGLFVSEATEHLEALTADLVQLEKDPSRQAVESTFRHAHSIKGMAASMGFEATAALAHRLEDLIQLVQRDRSQLTRELGDLLLSAADALFADVRCAEKGEPIAAHHELEAKLSAQLSLLSSANGRPNLGQPTPPRLPRVGPARRFAIRVQISPSCQQPAARALVALKRFSKLGDILDLKPAMQDLRSGCIPDGVVSFELESPADEPAIRDALSSVPEVELSSVVPLAKPVQGQQRLAPLTPPGANSSDNSRTVRIKTELLDYFLDTVGELSLATARIREIGKTLPPPVQPPLEESVGRLHGLVKDLHDKVMSARMTPLSTVTDRLPRAVRDLARRRDRGVELTVSGAEVELDRTILDNLSEPILHILRNCVDHGIESPDERRAANKSEMGRVAISVRRERDRVSLEIEDDGRGMDAPKLKQLAVAKGLLSADAAERLSEKEALMLCCLPGVSTAKDVSEISGRGVGMDAVKRALEELGGTLEIHSQAGVGTRFILQLPLTVSMVNLMLVAVGREIVGLPVAKVLSALELPASDILKNGEAGFLPHSKGLLPIHLLSQLLGFPSGDAPATRPYLVMEGNQGRVALAVDRLLGQEEAVLKTLTRPLDLVPGLAGVTILGTGRPVFILDVPRLFAA
jgi:two-component system chemotaxis sensor kinase CheA